MEFLTLLIFSAVASSASIKRGCEEILLKRIAVFYSVSWLLVLPLADSIFEYTAYYNNSNTMGNMALNVLAIVLLSNFDKQRNKVILLMISSMMIIISASRASIFAALVMIFSYWIFSRKQKTVGRILISDILFWGVVVGVLVFTIIYPSLVNTDIGNWLNDLSRSIFNKSFFSGRQRFWSSLLAIVQEKPILGHGLGSSVDDYLSADSAHNLYLQTALQCGWIGVIILLIFLHKIYVMCRKNGTKESYVAMAYLLGMLTHQCFEVSITQNNWPQGFFLWFILGLGMSNVEARENIWETNS